MLILRLTDLADNPRYLLVLVLAIAIALIIGISFHEFSHAFTAYLFGDHTAQERGRLTLNPAAHLDPFGTLMMLVIGFGWGKPTPVNPYKMRISPKTGMALVSLAGPVSNLLLAALFALPLKFNLVHEAFTSNTSRWTMSNYLWELLFWVTLLNIILCVFNLIPLAPLDGSKLAAGLLPGEFGLFFLRLEPYGMQILMVLFMLSWISPNLNVIGRVTAPLETHLLQLLAA
ncbi:MAG TPA: site-2 protease family protein [Dehalococcoidia bacterium]|nr:site-2 protease family protein [Dehalococcoidia bacterium]